MISHKRLFGLLIFTLSVLAVVAAVSARPNISPPFQLAGQFLAGDGATRNNFGYALDLDGNTAVIGAPRWNNTGGDYQGAAYVFTRDGNAWTEQAQLLLEDANAYEIFGLAVDLDGDTLAVSAAGKRILPPNFVSQAGAVYIYTGAGDAWTKQAALQPDDLVTSNRFGTDIALDGDTLIAGAPNIDSADNESAYIYRRNGTAWDLEAKLLPPGGAADFGEAVALKDDIALVCAGDSFGSPQTSPTKVYVYTRAGTTWSPAGTLVPDDGEEGDAFGCALAYDGQTAVVATHAGGNTPGTAARAHIFSRDGATWTQTAVLTPDPVDPNGSWRIQVAAVSGNRILLGAVPFYGDGAVTIYDRDGQTWNPIQTLHATNPELARGFGNSVASDDGVILVGAPYETVLLNDEQGAVHVFEHAPTGAYSAYLPVAVGPQPPPPPPASEGTIVYQDDVNTEPDIFIINPDGSGKTNLTNTPYREYSPRWSPDRSQIAFTRYEDGISMLMVMNADGSGQRAIPIPTSGSGFAGSPEWSPDGTRIAFHNYANLSSDVYKWDIYLVNPDGSELTNLTVHVPGGATNPSWSPDGQRIVFRLELPNTNPVDVELLIINIDGTGVTNLSNHPLRENSPDWSPDGTAILYSAESGQATGLYVIPATGGEPHLLIPNGHSGRWSSDGTQIAFGGGGGGVFYANADGSGLMPVDQSPNATFPDW